MTKTISGLDCSVWSPNPLSRDAPTIVPSSVARTKNDFKPGNFGQPFCDFLTKNPTVFHAVQAFATQLQDEGFTKLSERETWKLEKGGKYFVERNGSSMVAFVVGGKYEPGHGAAMIAGHVDALTAKLKPIPKLENKAGFVQLGVAPYAGGLNDTWWDRDLGIAGRVVLRNDSGKMVTKLVDINEPIARIPTLAPHFGAIAMGPFNQETQMVPIIGLDNKDRSPGAVIVPSRLNLLGGEGAFATYQPPRLVEAIAAKLGIKDDSQIVNWELELYDVQPAVKGGLDKEFIYGGRVDDKLCSWSAIQALLEQPQGTAIKSSSGIIKCVGLFDDEEIGSLLRQGARSNFLPSVIERIVDCFTSSPSAGANLIAQTYANSFLISADVTHAVNPNFMNAYLANHAPRLNVGVAVSADSNGHMTTDAVSTAILQRVADKCGSKLQVFQIRNDVRSGGTVGPMLSSAMGCRAVDVGIPQLSMHSIRAATGVLDPGIGVQLFAGFFDHYEEVDQEFRHS